ncbi:hypothetical protein NQZ68_012290 [Dissostichus eleginoides]|nr:hypothetical protein NQZ68_012290 [Dissostichus eleginoides]
MCLVTDNTGIRALLKEKHHNSGGDTQHVKDTYLPSNCMRRDSFITAKRKLKQGGESCFSEAFQDDKSVDKPASYVISTMSSPLRQQASTMSYLLFPVNTTHCW